MTNDNISVEFDSEELLDLIPKDIEKGYYAKWIIAQIQKLLKIEKLGVYYYDIQEIMERLRIHEEHAICWIKQKSYLPHKYMSGGYRDGVSPLTKSVLSIVTEEPTSIPPEELGPIVIEETEDYIVQYRGGFVTIDAAKTFIKKLTEEIYNLQESPWRKKPGGNELEYTLAKFDKYMLMDDYLREIKAKFDFDIKTGYYPEISKIVENLVEEATEKGIGLLPDHNYLLSCIVEEYSKDPNFVFDQTFEIDD